MNVVADATVLVALSRIGQLKILAALFDVVLIPPAVDAEVRGESDGRPGADELVSATWIETRERPDDALFVDIPAALGDGEREAIALAIGTRLPLITDDRDAAQAANNLSVAVLHTLALLVTAEESGVIPDARAVLTALVADGFRVHKSVIARFNEVLAASRAARTQPA